MVAASLQWCTRHPQVAATITPEEAVENAQAGAVEIPESFWEELAPLVRLKSAIVNNTISDRRPHKKGIIPCLISNESEEDMKEASPILQKVPPN